MASGRTAGTGEGLEKSRLHSQRVCRCWLTNEQGRESPAPWLPPHRAAESKWGNTPLCPLHTTSWHWIWSRQALREDPIQGCQEALGQGLWGCGAAAPVLVLTQPAEAAQVADSSTAAAIPLAKVPQPPAPA